MIDLLLLAAAAIDQVPGTTTVITTPAPAPDPVATMTRLVKDPGFQAGFGSLLSGAINTVFGDFTHGMFDLLRTAWGLPGAIFHRDALANDPRIVQLNAANLALLAGFVGMAMVLAGFANVVAIRKGQPPSAAGVIQGFIAVVVATFAAASSIDLLAIPIDIADLIFDTIGAATLVDYAEPGLTIVQTPFPIGGIFLALIFFAVMAYLTFVFYKELAWCGLLLSQSVLWMFAWMLPWSVPRSIGGGLGMRFMGTLFSPALALAALRLAAPTLGDLTNNSANPLLVQMFRILYAMVAYEAPGVIAGAIAVHMPAFGDAFLAGRAVGLFRTGPTHSGASPGGPAAAGHAGAQNAPRASSTMGWNANGPASGKLPAPLGSRSRPIHP